MAVRGWWFRLYLAATAALCLTLTAAPASARRVATAGELRQLAAGAELPALCLSALIAQRAPAWAVATYRRDAAPGCDERGRALLMHRRAHGGWAVAGDARAAETWCTSYGRFQTSSRAPVAALLELRVCAGDSEVWSLLTARALNVVSRQLDRWYRAEFDAATGASITCDGVFSPSPERPVRVPCRFDLDVGKQTIRRSLVTATWKDWRFVVKLERSARLSLRPVACGRLPDKRYPKSGLRIVERTLAASPTFGCDTPFRADIDQAVRRALPEPLEARYSAGRYVTDLVGFRYDLSIGCSRSMRPTTGGTRYAVRCTTTDGERLNYRFTARSD